MSLSYGNSLCITMILVIVLARKHSGQPPISDPVELMHPAVQPASGEVVVGKQRVNALHGTPLDLILRTNARATLIMLGYATSGVGLSSVCAAADLAYRLVVVEDCCTDEEADVHDFLTRRIVPRQAEGVTSREVIQALTA